MELKGTTSIRNALGDTNSPTWFSTTLFVLATGIRPWSHLINRLRDRTHELHTALHFPDEESLVHMYEQSERKLRSTLRRVDNLERELLNLRDTFKRLKELREVCDDLTEILGDVKRAAKRSERKVTSQSERPHHRRRTRSRAARRTQEARHRRHRGCWHPHSEERRALASSFIRRHPLRQAPLHPAYNISPRPRRFACASRAQGVPY